MPPLVLQTPVLLAVDAYQRHNVSSILNDINISLQNLRSEKAQIFGCLLNQLGEEEKALLPSIQAKVEAAGVPFLGHFPQDRIMGSVRLDEIAAATHAKLIAGRDPSRRIAASSS